MTHAVEVATTDAEIPDESPEDARLLDPRLRRHPRVRQPAARLVEVDLRRDRSSFAVFYGTYLHLTHWGPAAR